MQIPVSEEETHASLLRDFSQIALLSCDIQHWPAVELGFSAPCPVLASSATTTAGEPASFVNVLDSKGGFGVSVLGKEGTRDRAIALAKIVESHR